MTVSPPASKSAARPSSVFCIERVPDPCGIVIFAGFKQKDVAIKNFRKAIDIEPDIKLDKVLANQAQLLANQETIQENQDGILKNQQQILANQGKILA